MQLAQKHSARVFIIQVILLHMFSKPNSYHTAALWISYRDQLHTHQRPSLERRRNSGIHSSASVFAQG